MNIIQVIDHLKTLLTTEEQKEFIETIRKQAEFIETRNRALMTEKSRLSDRVGDLEDFIEEMEKQYDNEIDAGIGIIEYNADNIQLEAVMEALSERIDTTSPNDIIKLLEIKRHASLSYL